MPDRRHVLIGLAGLFPAMAKAKKKHKTRCVSGVDRWRPGSVIPVGFCDHPEWLPGLQKASANWNSLFGRVTLSPQECVPQGTRGAIAIIPWRVIYNGEPHHGIVLSVDRDTDGYIIAATIGVNLFDYYQTLTGDSSLMCHEIGHALGEGHDPESYGGCMARTASGGPLPGDPDYPGPGTVNDLGARYDQPEVCRRKH